MGWKRTPVEKLNVQAVLHGFDLAIEDCQRRGDRKDKRVFEARRERFLAAVGRVKHKGLNMGFEVFSNPGMGQRLVPVGQGFFNSIGKVKLAYNDLARVSIRSDAVVLVDPDLQRIALRKPDDEQAEPATAVKWSKSNSSGVVPLAAALKHLGLDPKRIKGMHPVSIKDNLLIIELKTGKK